jgi:segregation and condensation protein A
MSRGLQAEDSAPERMPPDPERSSARDGAGLDAGSTPAASAPADAVPAYRVQLPMFEGPLDLLLHLVQKHELDILNIPIAFITEKYVEYIHLLDELNIDVASEYLVMAATLVHIKSRMLLPNAPVDESEDGSEEDALDPRAELVRRLLEYQKYKLAAEQLGERSLLGRDVFGRGSSDAFVGGEAPLEQVETLKLLDAFQTVLERTQRTREHQIDFERFSLSEKISELSDRLRQCRRLVFHEIFVDHASRAELIITFLALLEMTRLRLTRLRQDGPLEPIYIELSVADEDSGAAVVDEEAGSHRLREDVGSAVADAARPSAVDPADMDPSAVDPPDMDPSAVDPADMDPSAVDPADMDPDLLDPDLTDRMASHPADIQLDPPDRGDLEEYE